MNRASLFARLLQLTGALLISIGVTNVDLLFGLLAAAGGMVAGIGIFLSVFADNA